MKEIKKIGIKEFCKQYQSRVPQLQETYLKENLVITRYVPFVKKDALAQKLVDVTTYRYEDYTKEDGTVGRRKGNIHVNSTGQYLLFCRLIIENYTNLTVETEGFFEEYDLLKQTGLLDKLMIGTDKVQPLVPMDEIAEFRTIVDMKVRDEMTNYNSPQSYVSGQVERFGNLLGVTLKPIMDRIATAIENMDEKDVEKLNDKIDKMLKRVK